MKTKFNRRSILAASAAAALAPGAALFPGQAGAQAWPNKPIRWVVPYTAGGLTDSVTRLTLEKTNVGQTFVVDNKPGANSLIGAEIVANAPPDGYTFLTVIAAHAANKTLYEGKLKFDPVASFAPVSLVGIAPIMILVSNDMPVKSVGELIDYAKKNPGKISFGSSGVGAAAHLSTELIMQVTGTKMVHVPYKGTAPALADLMSGNLQLLLDVPIGTMSQVRAGKVRALAMMSKDRVPGAEDIPTIVESGGPLIESSSWVMFMAPANTPKDIVDKLGAEVAKAVKDEALRKRLAEQAVIPVGATPAETAKFLNDEVEKWRKVITTAGVKIEA
ncbi:tripartite tricarboxylate transporter substrate binding protein [Reyranella sp.]|uniref:Bug family tripartite tricarboxylate transporter substrate binding protein n=1 Tax=Reyranella sp. TaxID=1929291 RepID=UPI00122A5846|nr:tripartite tricarboxylate transporter substrate binding protein [Reyranella sp.]TAJ88174.1 MAG: tripartite tricarboxylate transporter substrate binding protein [Reyranella sp.]